jgi:hypothetical protein
MSNSANITLPSFQSIQPTEQDGYMIVARDLVKGVEALSFYAPNVSPRACALIAAQALECLLKAFLWRKTENRGHMKSPSLQHNLEGLWTMAANDGLTIPPVPPDWVKRLSSGHGPNFYFRYQQGINRTVVNGGSTPELVPMNQELNGLLELVALEIHR